MTTFSEIAALLVSHLFSLSFVYLYFFNLFPFLNLGASVPVHCFFKKNIFQKTKQNNSNNKKTPFKLNDLDKRHMNCRGLLNKHIREKNQIYLQ